MNAKKCKKLRKRARFIVTDRMEKLDIQEPAPLYRRSQHPFAVIPERGFMRVRKGIPRTLHPESVRGVYHIFKKLISR